MNLLWPGFLILLGLIPLLIVVYIWMRRRRRRYVVRFSSLSLVRQALPRTSRLRRHLPFALFLLALTSLVIALARPVNIVTVPTDQTVIILAIDVSLSMRQTDIRPTRLAAAEAAAISFVDGQKSSTQIGIVAFSGFAELIQPPTTDQESLQTAIESLTYGRRTAIGSGILKSLDAIAEVDGSVWPSTTESSSSDTPLPVPRGAYAPDIVVLLTDGVSNSGPTPLEAAQQAADRGVRVYTIGYGTAQGGSFLPDRNGNAPFLFGGGGGQGFGGFRRGIDEETLKQVADKTGGEYYAAESADQLQDVFRSLPTYLIAKHEIVEISVAFAALGALFAAAAIFLSLIWRPLP